MADWGAAEWGVVIAAIAALITAIGIILSRKPLRSVPKEDPILRADWPKYANIPDRPREIQGRQEALKKLKAQIETSPVALTGERQNIVAASGSGGIGKSELANEFARQYKQNYEGVWIVRAESETTLHNDLAFLGTKIGCTPDLAPKQRALAVLQAVQELADYWLIIYDNVTDQAAINDYLITRSKLHYLITTRSTQWQGINNFPVGLLGPEEALELLRDVSGRDDEDLSKIVDKLDGYPLALVVAGAYLKINHGANVENYLESFDKRLNDLYAVNYAPTRDPKLKENYPPSILGSLSLTIDFLSPDATDLLSLASFLSPDDTWPELIEEGAKDKNEIGAHPWPDFIDRINANPQCLSEALTELQSASLVVPKDDKLTLHRLTQDVMRIRLGDECEPWADAAIRMVNALAPYDTVSPANWSRLNRLVPHGEILLDFAPASQAACRAQIIIGLYLGHRGNYGQAVGFTEVCLKISERINCDKPELHAQVLNNVAMAYANNEEFDKAEAYYLKALAIQRNGSRLNNLAGLYKQLERFGEAEPLYLAGIELTKNTLGEDHPNYAIYLCNLADLYMAWAKYDTLDDNKIKLIIEYEEIALRFSEQAHGPWHQSTATRLNNLAITYNDKGDQEKAIMMLRRATVTLLDLLGQSHPYTQKSLQHWLHVLAKTGASERDITVALESLQLEITSLRQDHVQWGRDKVIELEARYNAQGLEALGVAVMAEYGRLEKEGAPDEKSEWVKSELLGAVLLCKKAQNGD